MQSYPLKFRPIYKQRIWGGSKLTEFFGRELPAGEKIGESWELADLPDDKSVITNGSLAGMNIHEAIQKYPKEIMGREKFEGGFPLLIKILDAEDLLSVQVHPDEATVKRTGKGDPKTECWYIIKAEPGAVIYKGVKRGVTKEQFSEAIKNGTVAELLNKIQVHPGECHFLPAGTAHAIGAGLLIAEIQLPSDTTYRVFDWNRTDEHGRSRQLHIDDALESIHFRAADNVLPITTVGRLVDSRYFIIDKGHQTKGCERLEETGQMRVIMIINGGGRFETRGQDDVDFAGGDTILLPSAYEGVMCLADDTEYLRILA
ncbi:MAG: type I phosphomannose isomerase catalytic subunit [Phycisphaerae bacterium]|jgi:mannose-6-phosphate isomerase